MVFNGDNLKVVREQAGYTQKELSVVAGLGENAAYRMENNIDDPRFSSVIAIAESIDVSLDFLADRTQNPKSHKALDALTDLDPDIQLLVGAMQRNDFAAALDMLLKKVRHDFIEESSILGSKPAAE
jgi:transcriptional regulator with XRE-family HTH domain